MSLKSKHHWGTKLWGYIHTITIVNYDQKQNKITNQHVLNILYSIKNIIPCSKCINDYNLFLERLLYTDLSQPMILFYWSVDLHNYVNSKLNKPQFTYNEAINIWCN
jgi:hypothetical protein